MPRDRRASSQCPRPGRQPVRTGIRAQWYSRGPRAPAPVEILCQERREGGDQHAGPLLTRGHGQRVGAPDGHHVRDVPVFQPGLQLLGLPVGLIRVNQVNGTPAATARPIIAWACRGSVVTPRPQGCPPPGAARVLAQDRGRYSSRSISACPCSEA